MSENQADTKGKGVLERGGCGLDSRFRLCSQCWGVYFFCMKEKGKWRNHFSGAFIWENMEVWAGWHTFLKKKNPYSFWFGCGIGVGLGRLKRWVGRMIHYEEEEGNIWRCYTF